MTKKEKLPLKSKEIYTHIIGLDLSLTEPGWAKYSVDTKEFTYGIIDVGKFKGFFRIHEILGAITDKFDDIKEWEHILVIIEGYSFASKGNSAINLGELGGCVRYYFWQNKIEYYEVAPTVLKKFISNSGAAKKELMLKELFKNFAIDVNNDNICDAVGLCLIGRAQTGNLDKKLTKDQEKIVDSVFNPKEKKK